MSSDSDVLVHVLFQEKAAAKKAMEDARHSKYLWVTFTVVIGLFVGAWFGGEQGRKYYALGFEAGVMSTAEGRLAHERLVAEHMECDQKGQNCIDR